MSFRNHLVHDRQLQLPKTCRHTITIRTNISMIDYACAHTQSHTTWKQHHPTTHHAGNG